MRCDDLSCGSGSKDLVQCNECYATFCKQCYTGDYELRHQAGTHCMADSGRKLL